MQQLSGLDSLFIHYELPNSPMHIAPLFIYDPSTAKNGKVRFKEILELFQQRLDCSCVFRRKLAPVPFNLDQPYWIEDGDFDLEYHVRHIALPKPGDWRQFCIQISRLHARPLDRSRPLWEAYVIEGLDNIEGLPRGCFALFLKIHHAAIDGASGMEITGAIHDLTAMPEAKPSNRTHPWKAEKVPSNTKLLWNAYINNLRQPLKTARVIKDALPALQRLRRGKKDNEFRSLGEKERTRFNGPVTPHRVFGATTFALADVRDIKNRVTGATVNDVILTIVGGALRKYLDAKGELPEKSLVAGVPINIRSEKQKGSGGNVVSAMSISLCSDIADPLVRLSSLHQGAMQSKAYHDAMGANFLTDLSNSLPAHLNALAFRTASATGLLSDYKPVFNTVVTNVPGPQVDLYMTGAKMVRGFGAAPIMDNLGLIHVVMSIKGKISISFQSCREMLEDPQFYEQCLQASFEELKNAVAKGGDSEVGRHERASS